LTDCIIGAEAPPVPMCGSSIGSLIVLFSFSEPHEVGDRYIAAENKRMNPKMKQNDAKPYPDVSYIKKLISSVFRLSTIYRIVISLCG
jgi:hypothetical protein